MNTDSLTKPWQYSEYLNSICNLIPPLVSSPDTSLVNPHRVILCNQDFLNIGTKDWELS